MLYTLLAFCFVAHLNDTPTPDSFQEPGAVFLGLPHRISETASLCAVHYSGVCGAGRVYRTISTHTPTAVTASVTGMANQTAPGPSRAGSA